MEGIGTVAAVGGVLLALVLLWAVMKNRQTPREEARTEKATHDLYAEIDREDEVTDPDKGKF